MGFEDRITRSYTFQEGTVAFAQQVNTELDAILTFINNLASSSGTLETDTEAAVAALQAAVAALSVKALTTEGTQARVVFNDTTVALQLYSDGAWVSKVYYDTATGKYIFDGSLSDAVISELRDRIAPALTVDRLDTSDKVQKYLVSDTSDVNYIKIYDQYINFITATTDGLSTEQAKDRNGLSLYWTDATHVASTTDVTAYPVMIYVYTEQTKSQMAFEDGGNHVPRITMGAGTGYTPDSGKTFIYKETDGFYIDYRHSITGTPMIFKITDAGIDMGGFPIIEFPEDSLVVSDLYYPATPYAGEGVLVGDRNTYDDHAWEISGLPALNRDFIISGKSHAYGTYRIKDHIIISDASKTNLFRMGEWYGSFGNSVGAYVGIANDGTDAICFKSTDASNEYADYIEWEIKRVGNVISARGKHEGDTSWGSWVDVSSLLLSVCNAISASTTLSGMTAGIAPDDTPTVNAPSLYGGKAFYELRAEIGAAVNKYDFTNYGYGNALLPTIGTITGTAAGYQVSTGTVTTTLQFKTTTPATFNYTNGEILRILPSVSQDVGQVQISVNGGALINASPIDGSTITAGEYYELVYVLATTSFVFFKASGGGGGDAVESVNGQTGVVVLDASDIAITDSGSHFTATDTEGALDELFTAVSNVSWQVDGGTPSSTYGGTGTINGGTP